MVHTTLYDIPRSRVLLAGEIEISPRLKAAAKQLARNNLLEEVEIDCIQAGSMDGFSICSQQFIWTYKKVK